MRALSELDRTMSVLLITHRHELLELADRVIAIDDGALSG
jgi:ABC-type transport system involved in cytochrome bd biosynthesis fused ATPase/permease subunit